MLVCSVLQVTCLTNCHVVHNGTVGVMTWDTKSALGPVALPLCCSISEFMMRSCKMSKHMQACMSALA